MVVETMVYLLHWGLVVGALSVSWARSRHVLHPHFVFTVMFCVYLSDFLVRGYDVNNDPDLYSQRLDHILPGDLYSYQILILTAIASILFATLFVRRGLRERQLFEVAASLRLNRKLQLYALGVAGILILGELLKRFVSVDWSLDMVLAQSMGVRGDRDWDRAAWEGGNFVFSLSTIFMPLCAVIAGYLIVYGRGWVRLAAVPIFVIVLFFLVTDGSRTPLAVVGAAMWFFAIFRWRSFFVRVAATAVVGLSIGAIFSLIALFRGYGYGSEIAWLTNFKFNYHQDDNYYRSLHAFSVADQSSNRWDVFEFFYAIAANPIPRAIWPDKPIIHAEFFGDFRLGWTTNFFFGESVAMFGVNAGVMFAVLWGSLLYLLLYRAVGLLSKPLGVAAYLLVALYVYMCMRSMMNVTHFMYLPIAGVFLVLVSERIARRRRRVTFAPRFPAPSGTRYDRHSA